MVVSAMQENRTGRSIWSVWVVCKFKQGDQGKPSGKVIFEQKTERGKGVSPVDI